ncbi:hypothetical protein SAMN05660477_00165 [Soonwooa buanensis]|uniref:Uncharacterized protein n=2 Tax=Soonwooa buanensis TaxID=619805 RepID=A0A1T5CLR7_9FLAO|nr:hypothetical protein SAMN05660477_00165 [Soonwooa buanensis]
MYFEKTKYSEITTPKQEGEFKMYIKRPGNFQNKFSIKSIKDNTIDVVGTNDGEILFNAVKINAYSYTRKTRDDGTFHHSEWNYYNKLYIDTGNQENDNYLNNVPFSAKFSFVENAFQGLKQKQSLDFYDVQHYKGGSSASVKPDQIDKLTFKKQINNQMVTVEYNNIPVVYQGQQDAWGDEGKNNW